MKILVTGATGLVGRRLVTHLEASGHEVFRMSRHAEPDKPNIIGVDLVQGPCKDARLADIDAVVNLMGESIFGLRWTDEKKKRIFESRVLGTRHLIESLKASGASPKVFISTSAVGYYGDSGDQKLNEDSPQGQDFLAGVCAAWEKEAHQVEKVFPGIRLVICRFGVVLSHEGGMVAMMRPAFSLAAGATVGSGKQWMSWIHELDLTEILRAALTDNTYKGVVNAVAPESVTNRQFSKALAKSLGSVVFLNVPAILIRLGLGEMADLVLFSQRAEPEALTKHHFAFRYGDLRSALNSLVTTG